MCPLLYAVRFVTQFEAEIRNMYRAEIPYNTMALSAHTHTHTDDILHICHIQRCVWMCAIFSIIFFIGLELWGARPLTHMDSITKITSLAKIQHLKAACMLPISPMTILPFKRHSSALKKSPLKKRGFPNSHMRT